MNHHGRRFLTVEQFTSRAADLNVKSLSNPELEFYEHHGLLLPSARTFAPVAHALAMAQKKYGLTVDIPADLDPPVEWRRLTSRDPGGEHPFDREMGNNPFIEKPTRATYEPWDERDLEITVGSGHRMRVPTVERFYDSWQVHIVDLLRSMRFFERAPLVRELPRDSRLRPFYEIPGDTDWAIGLRGMAPGYETLTRFSDIYSSAMDAARAGLRDDEYLTNGAVSAFETTVVAHTKRILDMVGMDEPAFFRFVIQVFTLMRDHKRDERSALADDVERDLWLAHRFAEYAFGYDWAAFADAFERHGGRHWATTLRRLDPIVAARDEAEENLTYILQSGLGVALAPVETETLPQGLTEFCVRNELFEVLTGLKAYSFSDEAIRADRYPWFRYRRLRPLALAVEQLARGVLEAATLPQRGKTMGPLFETLAHDEPWEAELKRLLRGHFTNDKTRLFEQQVTVIQAMARPGDPEHLTIARTIVLAIIARNLASHRNRAVADATVRVLAGACGRALAITWLLARRAGHV